MHADLNKIDELPTPDAVMDLLWPGYQLALVIGNPAVDALSIVLQHETACIRQESALALEKIGTPEARQALATHTNAD
jgi:hypothetical protein